MLWETSQQLTDLPPLPHDARRFIVAFLNCDQDINELAEYLNEDFFEVVHKLSDPAIKTWISAINALKNNERRERALNALDTALTNEHNPNHIRRAATRILRHFEVTTPRTASRTETSRAIDVVGTPTTSMRITNNALSTTPPLATPKRRQRINASCTIKFQSSIPNQNHQISTPDLSESTSEGPGQTPSVSPTSNTTSLFSVSSVSSVVKSTNTNTRFLQNEPPQNSHSATLNTSPTQISLRFPHLSRDSPNLPPNRRLSGLCTGPPWEFRPELGHSR